MVPQHFLSGDADNIADADDHDDNNKDAIMLDFFGLPSSEDIITYYIIPSLPLDHCNARHLWRPATTVRKVKSVRSITALRI